MQNSANTSHVVAAAVFLPLVQKHLEKQAAEEFRNAMEAGDCELVMEALEKLFHQLGLPNCDDVFALSKEDESQDLESDTMYVAFAESDLYIRQPTQALTRLQAAGITPTVSSWVKFG